MAYLTAEKTDLGENAAAVLTATEEIQTDYTCPWTTALQKYESDMPVRYEPARPLRSSSSSTQPKVEKAVRLSDTDKHSFFIKQENYKCDMQLLKLILTIQSL